jgi:hypothetical protein
MQSNGTTATAPSQRAEQLAHKIRLALSLLGMPREVVACDDVIVIGDIELRWTETWIALRTGGGERGSGQAGWEVRLLPAAMPSGIIHNDRSAIQQTVVLVALQAIEPVLSGLPPATSSEIPDSGE